MFISMYRRRLESYREEEEGGGEGAGRLLYLCGCEVLSSYLTHLLPMAGPQPRIEQRADHRQVLLEIIHTTFDLYNNSNVI